MTSTLPVLFVSHGSPMTALEPGAAGARWAELGRTLPRPRAVLVASAHWETELPMLTGSSRPRTIHDFGGFPPALHAMQYPAPGAPDVAAAAAALLKSAGFAAAVDGCRGIDHGVWVPLLHMFPAADVPVVELSVQPARGAPHHIAVGRALAPLAREGVLIVGSGHVTHNLGDWMRNHRQAAPLPYVTAFAEWVSTTLAAHDQEALEHWQDRAPAAQRAHPTDEHFLPLLVAYGAAGANARSERIHEEVVGGALAMDAYRFATA